MNETFAKKFGLGRDAVGKFMGTSRGDSLNIEIVGLVKDAKYSGVKQEMQPLFMTAVLARTRRSVRVTFYVRTAGDPAQLIRAIPGVVAKLDPNLPVDRPQDRCRSR